MISTDGGECDCRRTNASGLVLRGRFDVRCPFEVSSFGFTCLQHICEQRLLRPPVQGESAVNNVFDSSELRRSGLESSTLSFLAHVSAGKADVFACVGTRVRSRGGGECRRSGILRWRETQTARVQIRSFAVAFACPRGRTRERHRGGVSGWGLLRDDAQ